MDFTTSELRDALKAWRSNINLDRRAEADNLLFEERIGPRRRAVFEQPISSIDNAEDLRKHHIDYWKEHVAVAGDIPHTFRNDLDPADLGTIDEAQRIVRVEGIQRVLDDMGINFAMLEQVFAKDDGPVLDKFLGIWDTKRDARPCFAAFRDEVGDELAAPDWPCCLRDRLGLAHYDPKSAPIPIALMEYSVAEVLAALHDGSIACAFTVPTVLDSGPWPYFFPAPAALRYGRAMPLIPVDSDDMLLAEILHCRLTYQRHHLVRLGRIERPVGNLDLRDLRNHHLLALQIASGDEHFGEEIT